jgi:hypothetical protein
MHKDHPEKEPFEWSLIFASSTLGDIIDSRVTCYFMPKRDEKLARRSLLG